jgi:pre-rRNA-processing protein TSR3
MKHRLSNDSPRLLVYLMKQDDPKKCTSAKLFRFNCATAILRPSMIPRHAIALNPFAPSFLLPSDREIAMRHGICAIDCSWENAGPVFRRRFSEHERKLPTLLAANPTHYSQPSTLSSLEALAGALFIFGMDEQALRILSLFKWGPTFLTLNEEPLRDYANAKDEKEMGKAQESYF